MNNHGVSNKSLNEFILKAAIEIKKRCVNVQWNAIIYLSFALVSHLSLGMNSSMLANCSFFL